MGGYQSTYKIDMNGYLYLREDCIQNICKCTGMTKDEVYLCHRNFLADVPTGRLDKKQFRKFYKQFYPNCTNDEVSQLCKIAFKAYDSNLDGHIEFNEFIDAILLSTSKNIEDKLNLAFRIYDHNNDGTIQKKEAEKILKVLKSMFKMYDQTLDQDEINKYIQVLMLKFDADKNGKIDKNEFIAGCLKNDLLKRFET